jgi:hypothetical protein
VALKGFKILEQDHKFSSRSVLRVEILQEMKLKILFSDIKLIQDVIAE